MEPLQLRLRLGFLALRPRSRTASRIARLIVALSDAQKKRLDGKFKKQYQKYKKEHPDSKKSEGDYIKGLWDKYNRATTRNEDDSAAKKKNTDDKIDKIDEKHQRKKDIADKANSPEGKTPDVDDDEGTETEEEDIKEEADIDVDIDEDDLRDALSEILGDKDDDEKDIGERLEDAAETLTDVVEVDEYITGLPAKAKELAQHLRKVQEENEETAEKVLGEKPNISYNDYVKEMDGADKGHITRKDWEAMAAKLKAEADSKREEKESEADSKKDEAAAKREKGKSPTPGEDKAETVPKGEPKDDGSKPSKK